MIRATFVCVLVAATVGASVPAAAQERALQSKTASDLVAPSAAVAAAWAKEENTHVSVKTTKVLYFSYAALQAADMYSTVVARRRGAIEANPLMNTGLTGALSLKSVMTVGAIAAVNAMGRKNKKAAFFTMIAMNSMTAIVVANNARNAARLK